MNKDWEKQTIGDLCEVKGGKRLPKGDKLLNTKTDYPYIRVTDFNGSGGVDTENIKYLSKEVREKIKNYTISDSDLFVSIAGTIGLTGFVPKVLSGANLTENACKLVLKEKIDLKYLYYFTLSSAFREEVKKSTRTAAQPKLALTRIKDLQLSYPKKVEEQKRIVGILDEKFEAIEKLKKVTEEQIKDSKELFESRLEEISSEYGNTNLFSISKLVDEGVIEKPLDGNHGEIHPKAKDFVKVGVPFVMASDLKSGQVDQINCHFISKKQASSLRKGFAKNNDILLSHKGTVGRVAKLSTNLDYVVLTPQVTYYRILDDTRLFNNYLYFIFKSRSFQKQLNYYALEGSTRAYIGITKQLSLNIPLASLIQQKTAAKELENLSIKSKDLNNIYQIKMTDLEELKKSYLEQAFAGKL